MFNLDHPVHENESWSMFWPRPICPGHGDQDHDQRISLELDVSRGGGRVQEKRCRDVSPDKIDK